MASKKLERQFLDKMLRDLRWEQMQVEPGSEPPDFFLTSADGTSRIAVEVTCVYRRETSKGSPEAEQERAYSLFVSDLAEQYSRVDSYQPVQVTVVFPPTISSSAVRRLTPVERRKDVADVKRRALSRLRHLPKLGTLERHSFQVRQRDGRPLSFHVTGLPPGSGLEKRWDVMNHTVGWVGSIHAELLQRKVSKKARDLHKYRSSVGRSCLLVVADGSTASGFLDLQEDVAIDPLGFDSVYFQRYPFDDTVLVRSRPARSG